MARRRDKENTIALSVKPLVSKTICTETELNEAIDAALEALPQELASQALAVQAALASPGDWERAQFESSPVPEDSTTP